MTNYLKKSAQYDFFQALNPMFRRKFDEERERRVEAAHENKASFHDAEEVISLIQHRKGKLEFLIKLVEIYKTFKTENEKEAFRSLVSPDGEKQIKEYIQDEDTFLILYNKRTDEDVDYLMDDLAREEQGIKDLSPWDAKHNIEKELKARLAVMPATKYEDIVNKLEKEFDINTFFNN